MTKQEESWEMMKKFLDFYVSANILNDPVLRKDMEAQFKFLFLDKAREEGRREGKAIKDGTVASEFEKMTRLALLSSIQERTKERCREAYLHIPESMRKKLTKSDKQHFKNGYNQALSVINDYLESLK